jgi:hypothetical protein
MTERNYKFICEKCNYKGYLPSQWEKHLNTELHKTGKRKERTDKKEPYKCLKCEYETKNKLGLKQHILNNHTNLEEREKEFKYYCKKCNFGTFSIEILNNHNNTLKHKYNEFYIQQLVHL